MQKKIAFVAMLLIVLSLAFEASAEIKIQCYDITSFTIPSGTVSDPLIGYPKGTIFKDDPNQWNHKRFIEIPQDALIKGKISVSFSFNLDVSFKGGSIEISVKPAFSNDPVTFKQNDFSSGEFICLIDFEEALKGNYEIFAKATAHRKQFWDIILQDESFEAKDTFSVVAQPSEPPPPPRVVPIPDSVADLRLSQHCKRVTILGRPTIICSCFVENLGPEKILGNLVGNFTVISEVDPVDYKVKAVYLDNILDSELDAVVPECSSPKQVTQLGMKGQAIECRLNIEDNPVFEEATIKFEINSSISGCFRTLFNVSGGDKNVRLVLMNPAPYGPFNEASFRIVEDQEKRLERVFEDFFGKAVIDTTRSIQNRTFPPGNYDVSLIAELTSFPRTSIGWYPAADPSEIRGLLGNMILSGEDVAPATVKVRIPEEFGIWVSSVKGFWKSQHVYNRDSFDHFKVFDGPKGGIGYALGIEEERGGGDLDFQDSVIFLKHSPCVITAFTPQRAFHPPIPAEVTVQDNQAGLRKIILLTRENVSMVDAIWGNSSLPLLDSLELEGTKAPVIVKAYKQDTTKQAQLKFVAITENDGSEICTFRFPELIKKGSELHLDKLRCNYDLSDDRAKAGVFEITATLRNITSNTIFSNVFFRVMKLTGEGNTVLNADGGPAGEGSLVTANGLGDNNDGVLSPGETFTKTFLIGLGKKEQFEFFVHVAGNSD